MKIAIPTRNNVVDEHFGHCEYYTIITVDDDHKIVSSQFMASPEGCGCKSDIAPMLSRMGVSLLLAGNMGAGALHTLNANGIEVVRGCNGQVNMIVEDYLAGKIQDSGEGCQQHEEHHQNGHTCQH